MTRRKSLLAVLIAFPVIAFARDASACSCMDPGEPCQAAFRVNTVFVGTVRTISTVTEEAQGALRLGSRPMPTNRVEFDNVIPFRGGVSGTATVMTAEQGSACGYAFKPGVRYVVYAHQDGARLVSGLCSRTRPLSDAADDIRFLQSMPALQPAGARLYGSVVHGESDPVNGEYLDHGPVEGVLITVTGSKIAATRTDAGGKYSLTLPPGKYAVTATPPPGFSNRYLQQQIELSDVRACHDVSFGVRYDGRIKGALRLASGAPAGEIKVEAMVVERVGRTDFVPPFQAETDSGGVFELTDLPPGRYLVGVDLTRRMDAERAFPTTFYPGTSAVASATVIEIGGGQRREIGTLTLPPERRSFQITGVVVYEDGRPASGATIALWDGQVSWRQVAVGIRAGADGTFSFLVHDGLSYLAKAVVTDALFRQIHGNRSFVATDGLAPLRIVIR